MSSFLFIQLPPTESITAQTTVDWLRWDAKQGRELNRATSSLGDLKQDLAADEKHSYVLILPGEKIRSLTVTIPNSSKAAISTVPFQLEERLSNKLEELHIVSAKAVNNQVCSLVTQHSDMQQWLEVSEISGINFSYFVADYSLLPHQENLGSIWSDSQRILINSPEFQGVMTPLIYSRHQQQLWAEPQAQLSFYCANDFLDIFPKAASRINTDLLSLMARNFVETHSNSIINLRWGKYTNGSSTQLDLKRFKAPIIALCLLLVTLWALAITDNYQLEQQNVQVKKQMTALYRQLFPKDLRVSDPHAQMRGKLRRGDLGDQQRFLTWMADISPLLKKQQIQLVNLKYNTKPLVLRLQIEARDYNTLENLALEINQHSMAKLQASLGTLQKSSINNSVTSLLTLKEQ